MDTAETRYIERILDEYSYLLDSGQVGEFYKRIRPLSRRYVSLLLYELNPEVFQLLEELPNYFMFSSDLLQHFDIPTKCTCICRSAFEGCSKLTSVTIPEGVVSIEDGAFSSTPLKKLSLPDSLQTIGSHAFSGIRALTIELGSGVSSIGRNAFAYLTHVKSFSYRGTVELWDLVLKDKYWCFRSNVDKITCANGDVIVDTLRS